MPLIVISCSLEQHALDTYIGAKKVPSCDIDYVSIIFDATIIGDKTMGIQNATE